MDVSKDALSFVDMKSPPVYSFPPVVNLIVPEFRTIVRNLENYFIFATKVLKYVKWRNL
jgi:hypothetical protein